MTSMLTIMPIATPRISSTKRSANNGSFAVKMKIAVVAMAALSSRIHDSRAPTSPTQQQLINTATEQRFFCRENENRGGGNGRTVITDPRQPRPHQPHK